VNITLSLDDQLVKRVCKIAVERDTTLTGMVRDYLEKLADEDSASGRKPSRAGGTRADLRAFPVQGGQAEYA